MAVCNVDENLTHVVLTTINTVLCLICWSWPWSWRTWPWPQSWYCYSWSWLQHWLIDTNRVKLSHKTGRRFRRRSGHDRRQASKQFIRESHSRWFRQSLAVWPLLNETKPNRFRTVVTNESVSSEHHWLRSDLLLSSNTWGEATSQNLSLLNYRHFVGNDNIWSWWANIYCVLQMKLNQVI